MPRSTPFPGPLRSLLILTLVGPVGVVALPERCLACSCAISTQQEQFAHAEVVFRGRVIEAGADGVYDYRYTFAVDTLWKGQPEPTVTLENEIGSSCNVEFEVGTDYVVYASDWDGALRTSICSGTAPVGGSGAIAALGPGTPVAAPGTPEATATRAATATPTDDTGLTPAATSTPASTAPPAASPVGTEESSADRGSDWAVIAAVLLGAGLLAGVVALRRRP